VTTPPEARTPRPMYTYTNSQNWLMAILCALSVPWTVLGFYYAWHSNRHLVNGNDTSARNAAICLSVGMLWLLLICLIKPIEVIDERGKQQPPVQMTDS
jgi:hypothetical protein